MTDDKLCPVNTTVITPNGKGVVQGFKVDKGRMYYMVRHVLKEMTSMDGKCLTPKALTDSKYPTAMWQYELSEVSRA